MAEEQLADAQLYMDDTDHGGDSGTPAVCLPLTMPMIWKMTRQFSVCGAAEARNEVDIEAGKLSGQYKEALSDERADAGSGL